MIDKKPDPIFSEILIREIVENRERFKASHYEIQKSDARRKLGIDKVIDREVALLKEFWDTEFWGICDEMQGVYSLIKRYAASEDPILILGRTGTGKELVAKAIHERSSRKDKPFTALNCTGFSPELLRSELFGHLRGAFTGATKDKKGLIEQANEGTLFLDEIGDMPKNMQAELLRFLNDKTYYKVGDIKERKADVRIIAATNKLNKTKSPEDQPLREDLLYRINSPTIIIPSLNPPQTPHEYQNQPTEARYEQKTAELDSSFTCMRTQDFPVLIYGFIQQFNAEKNPGPRIERIGIHYFLHLVFDQFPGGVRELRGRIRRACEWAHNGIVYRDGYTYTEMPPYLLEEIDKIDTKGTISLDDMVKMTWKEIDDLNQRSGPVCYKDKMLITREEMFFRRLARRELILKEVELRYVKAILDTHPGIKDREGARLAGLGSDNTFKKKRLLSEKATELLQSHNDTLTYLYRYKTSPRTKEYQELLDAFTSNDNDETPVIIPEKTLAEPNSKRKRRAKKK